MIILHDQSSSDLSHIQAIAEISEGFALFDYVRVEQQDKRAWIGQIVEANRNISIVGERLDPTILHGLNLMQLHKDVQSVQSVQVFDILILGQYDDADGQLLTPRLRPLPGSVVAKLNSQHTSSILELPACQDRTDGSTNAIGVLLNVDDVPLCVDARKFNYHVMVAGGTGSGKSNVAANLVTQAARFGKSVLIHDAKPDYGLINKPNSDSRVASLWSRFKAFKLAPSAALEVRRIGFHGRCNPAAVDVVAGFQSNDFNPDALASLFFSAVLETLQYESFAAVASALRQNVSAGNRQSYSLDDILAEVGRRSSGAQNIQAQDRIHELTGQAILRKAGSRRNLYPWLDAVGRSVATGTGSGPRLQASRLDTNARGKGVEKLDLSQLLGLGRIIVVDYRQMDDASYAAILSIFLRACQRLRRSQKGPGIVQLVDEAHRIFDNESRHGGTLSSVFERVMREGRSVDHSIVLSLQNASQIPHRVMNNLNTKFVMRQNSKAEAEAATQTMGKEFAPQSMRLGTGHALVSMHESRAIVLAQMAPSPFELMRSELEGSEAAIGGTGGGSDQEGEF